MMGDDMAIRSGGMYGNPASSYTVARPVSNMQGFGEAITPMARFAKMGLNVGASFGEYWANTTQIDRELSDLRREKEYNIKNYKQNIADVMARNKMSFYASGLDIKSGTAQDVVLNNKRVMEEDLGIMTYNYDVQEKSLKHRRRDLKSKLALDIGSSIISMF